MFRLITNRFFNFSRFKLEEYTYDDYSTMCGLIKKKYILHNDQIMTSGFIQLNDDNDNLIGIYKAAQARKKARSLNLDMVLVSKNTQPVVCKATNFRQRVSQAFFTTIVSKKLNQYQEKKSTVKNIKISPSMSKNEQTVKVKQIIQLSKKYSHVRVYLMAKKSQEDAALSILQSLKSQLMNKCTVQNQQFTPNQQNNQQPKIDQKTKKPIQNQQTFSFNVKSKQKTVLINQQTKDPNTLLKDFLKLYYRQDQGQMKDLKSSGRFQIDEGINSTVKITQQKKVEQVIDDNLRKQASARILNRRLLKLLQNCI